MPRGRERRRGSNLERAILEAAWEELRDKGLPATTMEGIAMRAQTSRPVLYRRWRNLVELAIAAMRHYLAANPHHIGDLGSIRDEMILFLETAVDRGQGLAALLVQMEQHAGGARYTIAELRLAVMGRESDPLDDILERAISRGEIDPRKLTTRVRNLALDLVRHDMLMTFQRTSQEMITEIVDEIFLPLVRTAN